MDAEVTLTGTSSDGRTETPESVLAPHLFVVVDAAAPLVSAARHGLAGVTEVAIGRGERRESAREGQRLHLRLPDRRASSAHARLQHDGKLWWFEDLGSKNGSLVDGRLVTTRTALHDGALLEVGHTFLLLRTGLPTPAATAADAAASVMEAPAAGLETLLPGLAAQFADLARYAATGGPVLILGETGTGKDVTARAYHTLSGRTGSFVPVNCGAVPAALVESVFFGHKRGAFSGATADSPGLVRSAEGGTLFLDELGDLPLPSQAALLRVIEAREVTPVGAVLPVSVDVRFVAATHRDIPAMITRGEFRADLWARLRGFTVTLPPLRARREDIGLLIAATLARVAAARAPKLSFSRDAVRVLLTRQFPLNVRELVNLLGRALALESGDVLGAELLRDGDVVPVATPAGAAMAEPDDDTDDEAGAEPADDSPRARRRRAQLEILLDEHGGNVTEVAKALGKARPLVYKWLKQLGIEPARYRK